ncbi:MAG TPA: hypothetical protein VNH84_09955 [Candidatus Saccharimonadales bacterium]|nr:hypothetical protein [Candidatus Saccharimonadales bacterium]
MMTPTPTWFRGLGSGIAALALLLGNGCGTTRRETQEQADRRIAAERAKSAQAFKSSIVNQQHQISIPELDQLTYGYADRYYMVMSSAVDAIKRGNTDPMQRRMAHQIKLHGVLAMNDIVSGNDPYAQIFDLVVSVTLESIVLIDENGAERIFGDRAPGLIKAIRTMRVEAWELAAKVLTQEQLELLDYIILEWRRTHPQIEQVAYVKFDNFAGARSARLLSDLKAGSGFLAPLSEASQVLKDWGRLTERAFWYSKRAPNIAAIQAEGAVNEILSTPEVNSMLQTADRLGKTAEAAPQTIDAQRKALFAELDARQTLLTNTLGDVRHIMADADSLGRTVSLLTTNLQLTFAVLGDTLKVADQVGRTFGMDKPPAVRPFDIRDYTAALIQLNEVVTNVHQLSLNADQLTRSAGWQKALKDMTDATDRRVDRVFSRLCLLLGLAFVLAIVYRLLAPRLARSGAHTAGEKP